MLQEIRELEKHVGRKLKTVFEEEAFDAPLTQTPFTLFRGGLVYS